MPMLDEIRDWQGRDLHGEGEDKIGEIADIYLDRATGEPQWLAVKTGMFGSNVSFVPIARAVRDGDHVDVPYTKDSVKDAPNVDADGELSPEEERRLYQHYDVAWGEFDYEAERDVGYEPSRPATDDAMTRSEEEMVVGKREEETGRARLRKYIVTEDAQRTVPVSREEVRVEREPITEGNVDRATDGPAITEDEHEVTLHAEEPVVEKRVVPKERVRLDKETRVEEETVSGELRKEQIEADTPRR
jgi:uncharacterized protein (TIGR02271 family)